MLWEDDDGLVEGGLVKGGLVKDGLVDGVEHNCQSTQTMSEFAREKFHIFSDVIWK